MHFQETSSFMLEWLRAPLVTASVVPSSRSLAKHMVNGLPAGTKSVIELGPGTGVFTNALLEAGIPEDALVLVELNANFASKLQRKYPRATIISGAAESLQHFGLPKADAVVSGLPLLSMHAQQIDSILLNAFSALALNGVFVQFTYGYKCPVNQKLLHKHNLLSQRYRFVLNNFPPASVYHLNKDRGE